MYPVSLFASTFPYAKQKSTYTCCLCEVHSVLKEKSCPYKQLFSCQCAHVTATFLTPQLFSCQCAHVTATFLTPQLFSCQCAPSLTSSLSPLSHHTRTHARPYTRAHTWTDQHTHTHVNLDLRYALNNTELTIKSFTARVAVYLGLRCKTGEF